MAYVVSLKQFDGPLDLLLTLITRAKIDIRDIFVSEITEQYLASMTGVEELDMDSASEFLEMAAVLVEIKSRRLLPTPPKEEDEEGESPEEALIRQLAEYKEFKELSARMRELEDSAKELIGKLPEEYPLPPPEFELVGLTLDGLSRALKRVLARRADGAETPAGREIPREAHTVQSCAYRLLTRLRAGPVRFSEMFEDERDVSEIVAMFLALLELMRLGRADARQQGVFDDIVVSGRERRRESVE